VILVAALIASVFTSVADATTITVTAPTLASATVAPNATVALTGASVSDSAGNGDQVLITVSAGSGVVSFTQTSGLTLATGYSSFVNVGTVAFQGTVANVNAALASMSYTAPAQTTSVSVSIRATSLADAGSNTVAYDPATGHFYEYVADPDVDWFTAQADANSMTFDGAQGYLATIPTAAVSSFVEQHLPAHDVWAGGESFDYPSGYDGDSSIQRVWVWADDANQFPSDTNFTPDTSYYGGPLAGEIFTECSNVGSSCMFTNQSAWDGAGGDNASWIESTWNGGEPNNSDSYGWTLGNLSLGPINGEHYLELNTNSSPKWNDLSPYQSTNGANIEGYVVEFGNNYGSPSSFPDSNSATSTNLTVAVAPGAPTGISVDAVSPAGEQASVTWSAPSNDGGSAITDYEVTASPGGETCRSTGTTCTIQGLTDGDTYTFTVRAVNAAGDSPTDTSAPATVLGSPFPPAALSATGVTDAGDQVTLSWSAPDDGGSAITSYTATASPGGYTCTTTSTSCTFDGLTDGQQYSFVVRATNAIGTSGPSSALTVTPSAPSKTAQVASSNLAVSSAGTVNVSLTCSGGGTPCEASGTLQIPAASLKARSGGMVTAARFDGVEVSPGTTTSTTIKLPPAILRELQAAGVRTVKATVTVDTGSSTTTDTVDIAVPTGLDVCPATVGSISGTTLGLVHLGESIVTIDSHYLDHSQQKFGFIRFCLSTHGAFRVEAPVAKLVAAGHLSGLRGKVVLALTANHHYALDGIRAGDDVVEAEKRLALGAGIASGLNTWYLIPGSDATGVLKVHDGRVAEVGIASRQVTGTPAEQLALFRQAMLP
jgi:hypothetical protein